MEVGDSFKFYWNDTTTPVWSTEIDLAQKNQQLVFRIEEGHIVRGDAFPVFYSVLRVGAAQPVESQPQWKLLVKLDPPGGFDEEQGTPGHSGLRYSIPQDIIDDGVGPGDTGGVPITIKPYRFMRRNDRINVAWGSKNVYHTVADGEVEQEITITVPLDVIEQNGDSDAVAVAYQVVDECGNYPGGYWRWSAATQILVDLNNNRLDPPMVLVNDMPVEEVDLEVLAGNPVIVRVNTNRYEHAVGDILRLTWRGTSADGFPVDVGPLEETVEAIPYSYNFTIPYEDVAAIARGRASVEYVRIRSGEDDRPSKSKAVTVVGDYRRYGPPGIVEATGNTLDPDLNFYTLSVPDYAGRSPGDRIIIVCEGLTASDHPTYYDVPVIVAGEVAGEPVLGNLPKAQVKRLDGGSLKVYYSVNGQPDSDVLELTVGVAAPSLPIPTVVEAPDDMLDPDEVNPAIGANVIVPYTVTVRDDVVVLRWRGSSSNAPDASRTLNANTAGKPVPFTVPFTYVSGNLNGTVDVSYSITRGTSLLGNSIVRHLRVGSAQLIDPTIDSAKDPHQASIANGGYTVETSVTLSGKAAKAQRVEIYEGDNLKGTAEANGDEDWSLTVSGLSVAPHIFVAKALYGDNPISGAWGINVVAVTPPTITSIRDPHQAPIANGGYTLATSITLSGRASMGMQVQIFDNADLKGTADVDGYGDWSLSLSGLAEGAHILNAKALYSDHPESNYWGINVAQALVIDTSPVYLNGFFLYIGQPRTATPMPAGTTVTRTPITGNPGYTYYTSNADVARVDGYGTVEGWANGQATITVADASGQTAAYTVIRSNAWTMAMIGTITGGEAANWANSQGAANSFAQPPRPDGGTMEAIRTYYVVPTGFNYRHWTGAFENGNPLWPLWANPYTGEIGTQAIQDYLGAYCRIPYGSGQIMASAPES
ncbi:hypothetical protein AO356_23035 [Pseudomonas fluorescens]|uniref:BIG2 domain-containing protein n=2 Tax=Pseudomonas TaxID=286 RepID=A0A0N9X1R9_PSEFL|nr:hypothetical protein AO356_23035 [Pseudomonas fluorescens]POA14196.1 hypothetical protein C1892_12215 [Pseudomonas sp. MPBD7-1]